MPRFQLRVTHLMLLIVVAAIFSGLAAMNSARSAARQAQCLHNLHQIILSLHRYVAFAGGAPPAAWIESSGRAMHSWRVVVWALHGDTPYDFRHPWDAMANLPLGLTPPSLFSCPNTQSEAPEFTNYAAIVEGEDCSLDLMGRGGPDESWIVLVEVPDSTIVWTEPRDVTPAEIARYPAPSDKDGYLAAFSDGRCRRLSRGEILSHWSRAKAKLGAAKSPGR